MKIELKQSFWLKGISIFLVLFSCVFFQMGDSFAAAKISAVKSSNTILYLPGGPITYTITITNSGNHAATGILVADNLSGINTMLSTGATGAAFSSWTISATSTGVGSTTGTFLNSTNLNTTVNIAAGGSVTYTITGTVANNAVGTIQNKATVNGVDTYTVSHNPASSAVTATKTSATTTYQNNVNTVYTLKITNTGTGFATGVSVVDEISKITTTYSTGAQGVAFSSWTISANTAGSGTTAGTYANNMDLNTMVNIAPGGSVTYTITARVSANSQSAINNYAVVNGVNTNTVTHTKKGTGIVFSKTSDTLLYRPGSTIVYKINVKNDGNSQVSNVNITDALSSVMTTLADGTTAPAFSGWTISVSKVGSGTTTGSFSNGNNLNTTVKIDASGSVTYTITATVKATAVGEIKNTAAVNGATTDTVTHQSSPAIVVIQKTSPTLSYGPGGTISYTLTLSNTGTGFADNVPVQDLLSTVMTQLSTGGTGPAFSSWTISATTFGAGTTAGTYSNDHDLDTTVDIRPTGSVTYNIVATVVNNAYWGISNQASAGSSNMTLSHSQYGGEISAVKASNTTVYSPGGTITYTLKVDNIGLGYLRSLTVADALSSVTTTLVNGNTGSAFSGWTISSTTTGVGTTAGTYSNNTDLSASPIIAPGGSVTYTIVATVAPNVMGTIFNKGTVNGVDTNVVSHTLGAPIITGTKTSTTTTYAPNGTIVYTLAVNNIGNGFATNVPIRDSLSTITTSLATGNIGAAFSSWTISAVPTGSGTTTGTFANGSDLNTTVNIAPGGSVVYTITGTVVNNAVGTINNQATVNNVAIPVVSHTSVPSVLTQTKSSVTTTYTPGGTIVYTLTVANTGAGFATNVAVEDLLSGVNTTLAGGGSGAAFSGWTISTSSTGIGTTTGTVTNNSNLDTHVTIAPSGSVTYTITATVVGNAIGSIVNRGEVNSTDTNSVTHTALLPNITATKTSGTTTYAPGGTVVYTLTVANAAGAGFASNVPVRDSLSSVTTNLASGSTGAAFSNWTISAVPTGTGTTTGIFTNGLDLNTTVNIAPGGSVVYTITGTVVNNAVGGISNHATVNNVDTSAVSHNPLPAAVAATLTVNSLTYAPGGSLVYTLTIQNAGSGYALNIPVINLLSDRTTTLANGSTGDAFSTWTISATTTGAGTTAGRFIRSNESLVRAYSASVDGAYAAVDSGSMVAAYSDGADINTTINIAPGGSVTYTITTTIANNAIGSISDSATVNGVVVNSPASNSDPGSLTSTKSSTATTYIPGNTITYTLTLNNSGTGYIVNTPVVDLLSGINTTLADGSTGAAFSGWTISAIVSGLDSSAGTYSNNTDLNAIATIAPSGSVVYTITANVAASAVGSIQNQANISGGPTNTLTHTAELPQVNGVKASTQSFYRPGGTITYTFTIDNAGNGYGLNVPVEDHLSTVTTTLADGTTGPAFSSWTITATTVGAGTVPGTYSNDMDLDTLVNIAPNGSIVYTIIATVVPNAIGPINNMGIVNRSIRTTVAIPSAAYDIQGNKTATPSNYVPGGKITYTLTIENKGDGFAVDIPIVDWLSSIGVTQSDWNWGLAFSEWTISATANGTGTTVGIFEDNKDLNTRVNIAPGGSVVYTIVVTISELANSTITNQATQQGYPIGVVNIEPGRSLVSATKSSNTTTYAPGGTITYTIVIKNDGTGFAEVPVKDMLSTSSVNVAGGGTGPTFSNWTITSSTVKNGSRPGTFANNTDLDTTATVAPGGSVTYTIVATVSTNAIGEIMNKATVDSVDTTTVTHTPEAGTVSATKSSNTTTYAPGGTIAYTITVNNTGAGYALNVPVKDLISPNTTNLIGGGTGTAFDSWTISATTTGTGTTAGTYVANTDLDTTVNIAPSGSVTYTITGTVVSGATGNITNKATVNAVDTVIVTHTPEAGTVSATKSSNTTTYAPGGTIAYTITLNNTGAGYALNVPVKDLISPNTTNLIGGGTGAAFASWTISATTTGTGTTAGTYTANTDLDTTVNIAPSGSVTYTITGTVVSGATGNITNKATVNAVDTATVTHTPEAGTVSATKSSSTTTYAPGGTIAYTITVNNTGAGYALNVPVKDLISSNTTNLIGGGTGAAFGSWTISATTTGAGTTAGTYANDSNLDTTVNIAPSGSVTYTITGTVVSGATGNITNKATVNAVDTVMVTHTTEAGTVSATKSSSTTTYAPGGTIAYTITVNNTGAGYALNVPVKDLISSNATNLIGGGTGVAFGSWTISATTTGTGTTSGTYVANTDLDTTVNIAPGGSVTYTITGTVVSGATGNITNKAAVNAVDTVIVTHTPEAGTVSATKSSSTTTYAPGGTIAYTITVNNTGAGYALNVPVKDLISSNTTNLIGGGAGAAFGSWTISATTTGTGTTSGTYVANTDLDTTVNIAPGGSVSYTITGTVVSGATGNITNKATVNAVDTVIVTHTPEAGTVSATKSSSTTTYAPGGTIAYTITVNNTGAGYALNVPVKDLISSNTTNLIGGGAGAAFGSWTISATTTGTGTTAGTYVANTDLDTTVNIAPNGSVTYTITGTVVSGATGNITNKATVNAVDTVMVTHTPEAGTVSATKSSSTTTYAPGGTIAYTITVNNTGVGYALNVPVKDLISSNTTNLISGGTGAAFGSWTITATNVGTGTTSGSYSNDTNLDTTVTIAPNGKVTYTITAIVVGNAVGTINNKATVSGIDTSTVTHTPEAGVVTGAKTTSNTSYAPGGTITYTLTVNNTGAGYALNIPVKDMLSTVTTTLADGTTGSAFSSWTISATTTGSGTTSGSFTNNNDLNTTIAVAPSGSVTYTIVATVANNAVGSISNVGSINNVDTPPTGPTTQEPGVVAATKTSMTTTYTPGQTITYTLIVTNTGNGFAHDIPVKDLLSSVTTDVLPSGVGAAFTGWTISAATVGTGTTAGTYSDNSDLDTTVTIAPGGSVTYTITGLVTTNAIGLLRNQANVNGTDTSPVNHTLLSGQVMGTATTTATTYTPNGGITYILTIENNSQGFAFNVPVQDFLGLITVNKADGTTGPALSSWNVSTASTSAYAISGVFANNQNLNAVVNLEPGARMIFTIDATVISDAVGPIVNVGSINRIDTELIHIPFATTIVGSKTSTTTTYQPGDQITYTLTLTNSAGVGFGNNIPVVDLISSITTDHGSGNMGPAFSSWTISAVTTGAGTTAGTFSNNSDLNTFVDIAPGGSVVYTIVATVAAGAEGTITNTFIGDGTTKGTTTHVRKTKSGLMPLTKTANEVQVKAGGPAGYHITLLNDIGVTKENIYIYDYSPTGFSYVEGSASKILANGEAVAIDCKVNGSEWIFGPFTLAPGEAIDIEYVAKVSATAAAGNYTNTVVAKIDGVEVSEQAKATVSVSVDTFANTATIIGKVYEDIDGDGWQDPAKASKVSIEKWDLKNAIPSTATITYYTSENKVVSQKSVTAEEIQKGEFRIADKIEGCYRRGNTVDKNKAVFRVEISKPEIGETFTIRTAEGMVLEVNKESMSDGKSHGDYSKGLTSQAFKVIREIKEENGHYFFELTLINTGLQEEGVPGVRLIITSGSVIYTDQYGRYHVPPEVIDNNIGSNYVIKLDPQSLPEGMKVISENPKAKLVSMYGLNEIDFEVQYQEEENDKKKTK